MLFPNVSNLHAHEFDYSSDERFKMWNNDTQFFFFFFLIGNKKFYCIKKRMWKLVHRECTKDTHNELQNTIIYEIKNRVKRCQARCIWPIHQDTKNKPFKLQQMSFLSLKRSRISFPLYATENTIGNRTPQLLNHWSATVNLPAI